MRLFTLGSELPPTARRLMIAGRACAALAIVPVVLSLVVLSLTGLNSWLWWTGPTSGALLVASLILQGQSAISERNWIAANTAELETPDDGIAS